MLLVGLAAAIAIECSDPQRAAVEQAPPPGAEEEAPRNGG